MITLLIIVIFTLFKEKKYPYRQYNINYLLLEK